MIIDGVEVADQIEGTVKPLTDTEIAAAVEAQLGGSDPFKTPAATPATPKVETPATPATPDITANAESDAALLKQFNVRMKSDYKSIDEINIAKVTEKFKDFDALSAKAELEKLKLLEPVDETVSRINEFRRNHKDKPLEMFFKIDKMDANSNPDEVIKLLMQLDHPEYMGKDAYLDMEFKKEFETDSEDVTVQEAFKQKKEVKVQQALAKFAEVKNSLVPPVAAQKATPEQIQAAKTELNGKWGEVTTAYVETFSKEPLVVKAMAKDAAGKDKEFPYSVPVLKAEFAEAAEAGKKAFADSGIPINAETISSFNDFVKDKYLSKNLGKLMHMVTEGVVAAAFHAQGGKENNVYIPGESHRKPDGTFMSKDEAIGAALEKGLSDYNKRS